MLYQESSASSGLSSRPQSVGTTAPTYHNPSRRCLTLWCSRSCSGSPCCPTQRRRACRVDRAEAMDAASTGVGGGCPKLLETRSCCAACETKAKPRCARRGEGEIRPVSTVPRRIWHAWYFSRGTGDSSCLLVSYRPLAHAGLSFKAAGRVAEKPHNNLLVRTPFATLQKIAQIEQA